MKYIITIGLLFCVYLFGTAGSSFSSKQNNIAAKCDSLQRLVDSLSLPVRHHISKRRDTDTWVLYVYREKRFNSSNGTFVGQLFMIEKDTLDFIPCYESMGGALKKFSH